MTRLNLPPLPPPVPQRSALDEMWQMHHQQMQALERMTLLLQQLLDAQTPSSAPPAPPGAMPR